MDVRIGAVYVLEGISRDSSQDRPVVMEVLCSFVRRRSDERSEPETGVSGDVHPPPPDMQAALTVIARRDHTRDRTPIFLEGANLAGANLKGAHLRRADMRNANLRKARLHGADLQNAFFFKADVSYAYLHGADLRHADLRWAKMEHVWANRADFRCARFWGADLRRGDLHRADLRNADLGSKEIDLVTPPGSSSSMTHLKRPFPEGWQISSYHFPSVKMDQAILLGAQLEGADLRGAEGLTREQVQAAANYSEHLLPEDL
ncbi:pentapeptide repeat-containing protein [Streptomyces phaeochromogenes]|uniref:pentapeptide repeat-containing protein n=1 Tax=Streptomyces phaeochromogenes TaxID=1923 RepID=UPI002E15F7E8|nr:pentapeptide repeat-containing protein [Streptomyces phaeochromogenes]